MAFFYCLIIMKRMRFFFACAVLSAAFFAGSCTWTGEPGGDYKFFDYKLQGTWSPNDPDGIYTGTLKIDIDRITITGYGERQTPSGEDDNKRPFKGFTKGTALKGYSEVLVSDGVREPEEGYFFIQDAGVLQSGIPYVYWEDTSPSDYRRVQFLRFNFGGREETLQKDN